MKNTYKLDLVWYASNGGHGDEYAGTLDVSADNCANWQDVTLAYKRQDMDAVTRSFSTSFDFVKDAYEVVERLYFIWNGIDAIEGEHLTGRQAGDYCRVELRLLQEDWTYPQAADYKCDLDFTSTKFTRGKVSISAIDNSLAALLKKVGGTTYTLTPFNEQERIERHVNYDGLRPMERYYLDIDIPTGSAGDYTPTAKSFKVTFNGSNEEEFTSSRTYGMRAVQIGGVTIYVDSEAHNIRRVLPSWERWVFDFATATRQITLGTKSGVNIRAIFTWVYGASSQLSVVLSQRRYVNGAWQTINSVTDTGVFIENAGTRKVVNYELEAYNWTLHSGDILDLQFNGTCTDYGLISDEYDAMIYLTAANAKSRQVIDIAALTPYTLADALSFRITGRYGANAAIRVSDSGGFANILANTYIFSAGWFNGGSQSTVAEFNVSYNDFVNWMATTFDYVPQLTDGGTADSSYITFVPRLSVFTQTTLASAGEDDVAEFKLSTKNNLIYSSVVAGYEKQSYDAKEAASGGFNVPVAYEVNAPVTTDRQLKIQNTWRADTYGLEQLIDDFDADSTESGDIFFLHCTPYVVPIVDDRWGNNNPYWPLIPSTNNYESVYYVPDRSITITSIDEHDTRLDRYVNAAFSPHAIAAANAFRIMPSIGTPVDARLQYTSQEGGDVNLSLNGVSVQDDVTFDREDQYDVCPRPIEVTFTTNVSLLSALLQNKAGIIQVTYGGYIYRGWLMDAKFHILHAQQVDVTLLINTIEKL